MSVKHVSLQMPDRQSAQRRPFISKPSIRHIRRIPHYPGTCDARNDLSNKSRECERGDVGS